MRELKNVIERAVILAGTGAEIRTEHLMIQLRSARAATPAGLGGATLPEPIPGAIHVPAGGKTLQQIEREAVRITLQLAGGNRSEAARMLGISRPTLARKLRGEGAVAATPAAAGVS